MHDEALMQPVNIFTAQIAIPVRPFPPPASRPPAFEITAEDVAEADDWPGIIGLGRMMNFPGVDGRGRPKMLAEIAADATPRARPWAGNLCLARSGTCLLLPMWRAGPAG